MSTTKTIRILMALFMTLVVKGQQKVDLKWVIEQYPDRVEFLFKSLDASMPELREVFLAYNSGYIEEASHKLLDYYKSNTNFKKFRNFELSTFNSTSSDRILSNFKLKNDSLGRAYGGINWYAKEGKTTILLGKKHKRHGFLLNIVKSYVATKDDKYLKLYNDFMLDWFIANPVPNGLDHNMVWMPLEIALHFNHYPLLFYRTISEGAVSNVVKLMFLITVAERAPYLKKFHWKHHNLGLHELVALARICVYWPELAKADEWFDYAELHMLDELEAQVLKDGAQFELSAHYHRISIRYFYDFVLTAKEGKRKISTKFLSGVESMYNHMAYSLRPNITIPLSGDSDLDYVKKELIKASKNFNRPDWLYIATNGKQGIMPEETSVLFPYSGVSIMRNGYNKNADWSFFDAGPWGGSHWHDDKLHVSIHTGGRDVLVDSGRWVYGEELWRKYFISTYAHNSILIDGKGQKPDAYTYKNPDQVFYKNDKAFTYAQATYDKGYRGVSDSVMHTRAVIYLKDKYWLIIDNVTSNEPHLIQALWHYHPDCNVSRKGLNVFSNDTNKGNIKIQPIAKFNWELLLHKGPESVENVKQYDVINLKPYNDFPIKSSYSVKYGQKTPSTVAAYEKDALSGNQTMAWLLTPFTNKMPKDKDVFIEDHLGKVKIKIRKKNSYEEFDIDLLKGTVDFKKSK